jgi:hypothetical protein
MDLDVAGLFSSPEQHFLTMDGRDAVFLSMDRQSYHRSIFLDARAAPVDPNPHRRDLLPLLDAASGLPPSPRLAWIFHIAHCGSTLLSRAIDLPGANLVLREPPPLRQLAIESASSRRSARWSEKLALAHRLAARRFAEDEPAIVKANVPVNFILNELLELDPHAPAIFLHMALESYLLAILRDGAHRKWVDRVTDQLGPALFKRIGTLDARTTAERAAALWLAQTLIFSDALEVQSSARGLDAETLFSEPSRIVDAALAHLGVAARPRESELGEILSHYSKNPGQQFSEADRRERQANDRVRLAHEILEGRRWIERAPAATNLPQALHRPLVGEAIRLF